MKTQRTTYGTTRSAWNTARVIGLLAVALTQLPLRAQSDRVLLTLKGAWPGSVASGYAAAVQVAGDYAYVAEKNDSTENNPGRLEILDVSNPASPMRVGYHDTREQVSDVLVLSNFAFVAEGTWRTGTNDGGALEVFDVSTPTNPVRIGGIDTRGRANRVHLAGTYAYVPESTRWTGSNLAGALEIFDVSTPTNLVRVATFETGGSATDVQVVGNYAYLADGVSDLVVLEVSNPANPVWIGSYDTNVWHADTPGGPAREIQVAGNYVYSVGADGLQVLDVTDPTKPVRVLGFTDPAALGIWVTGNYAFVPYVRPGPDRPRGYLLILDVSKPASPLGVGCECRGASWIAYDVQVVGSRVYIAAGDSGLLVYELAELPYIASVSRSGGNLVLSWKGATGLKLQRTASLNNPSWTDVPGSDGQSRVELPLGSPNEFFRLVTLASG